MSATMILILEGLSALCLLEGFIFLLWAYADSLPDWRDD